MMYCEHGNAVDENGCDICECLDVPVIPICPEVMCMMYCEHGNVVDEHGCEICECLDVPVISICPEIMCLMHCENGYVKDKDGCETCECLDVRPTPCTGALGDYKCVCEDGLTKIAEKKDENLVPVVDEIGRRNMAVYGEAAHCEGANTCKIQQEQPGGLAGPIDMFWDCLDLETFEIFDVTTHFVWDEEALLQDPNISIDYCDDYTFHCDIPVDCDVCVAEFEQNGGCECWKEENCNEEELVPAGCDSCGEEAGLACGITEAPNCNVEDAVNYNP